mmetsp:Transcript_8035/g.19954  ORF Transcript_8035/g.19954 Transcript_8035/m.19954 type:complete len:380 (-) Transcript_8035:287-1426(-)
MRRGPSPSLLLAAEGLLLAAKGLLLASEGLLLTAEGLLLASECVLRAFEPRLLGRRLRRGVSLGLNALRLRLALRANDQVEGHHRPHSGAVDLLARNEHIASELGLCLVARYESVSGLLAKRLDGPDEDPACRSRRRPALARPALALAALAALSVLATVALPAVEAAAAPPVVASPGVHAPAAALRSWPPLAALRGTLAFAAAAAAALDAASASAPALAAAVPRRRRIFLVRKVDLDGRRSPFDHLATAIFLDISGLLDALEAHHRVRLDPVLRRHHLALHDRAELSEERLHELFVDAVWKPGDVEVVSWRRLALAALAPAVSGAAVGRELLRATLAARGLAVAAALAPGVAPAPGVALALRLALPGIVAQGDRHVKPR